MRSFRNSAPTMRRPAARAHAALFPELADLSSVRLVDGLLRAPPRGRAPPPCLSAVVQQEHPAAGSAEGVSWATAAPPSLATPAAVLAARGWEKPALLARAAAARRALAAARVGGAWWQGDGDGRLPDPGCAVVALAEPAAAGCSGAARESAAAAMLETALIENPGPRIVILAPRRPAAAGLRRRLAAAAAQGAAVLAQPVDPWHLLQRAGRVYSAGGEFGFLALVADVPVRAFAGAFYTGWGVTEDAPGVPRRDFGRTPDELFAGACLLATRYRDPFRDAEASFEEVLAVVAEWRRLDDANRGIAACVGMSFWKRRRVAEFVRSSAGVPAFRRSVAGALAAALRHTPPRAVAGWASRLPDGLEQAAARHGVSLMRVEDGFIRSVGLGSDFLPPASLVFDARGMYFDPRGGSDLETLLRDGEFPPPLLARARRLAAQLVARGVTKYNLAGSGAGFDVPPGCRVILVPGQVEDDLSIRFGAGEVRSNLGLLQRVRAAEPDAFILYKPHPDVLAGHRKGAVPESEARRFADAVVPGGSIAALLALTDELHTMTSLAGFEALLRGRRVVVYGRPFYAGWGLTVDRPPFERGRRLDLDALVAGALILYPRYLDPLTRLPCGPEVVIERLDDPQLWRPGALVLARRLQGMLARRLGGIRAVLGAGPVAPRSLRQRLHL